MIQIMSTINTLYDILVFSLVSVNVSSYPYEINKLLACCNYMLGIVHKM